MQWSGLQRAPKAVVALADRGDVRVRRRDGAALLLTREDRATSTVAGAVAAARALRNLLVHVGPLAAAALVDEFPWSDALPEPDRAQFVADFVRAFQASAEIGHWALVSQTIREWQATAAVYADSELVDQLSGSLHDDFGIVSDPTED
ncbi:MAG: hypothetical protein ACRDS0_03675 [Pseudonocardiaceae bacterium]